MQKLIKVEEIVGKKTEGEEEPEGKVIVGPNREVVVHSLGNNPFFLKQSFLIISTCLPEHFKALVPQSYFFIIEWIFLYAWTCLTSR